MAGPTDQDTFEGPSASAATATRRGVAHENLHLAIVGAGPGGIAAGVQAAKRGVPHTLLERSKIAYTIERYQKGKFVMAEPPRLPLQETLDVGFEQGSREDVLAEWNRAVEAAGVNARVGPEHELQKVDGELGAFKLHLRGGDVLDASHVILAVGVQGNLRAFGVDGDHLPHVTYQLDDPAEHSGKRVVVVGVGDAGIENAIALMEHDNDVTIVNRRDEFARAKPRNRLLIENAIRAGEIAYYKDSTVLRFEPDAVWLSTNDGEARLDADLVIGRLGAIPPRKFLEDMGIEFPSEARDAVPDVSEIYESNIPGIHVVGALAGYPLIKNCMNQGYEVVEHLLGEEVTPADEPVLRDRFAGLDGSVPEILEQIRTRIPIFAGLTTVQLRELLFDSEIRQLGPDEVVFELNDFTNSFFAIYSGSVDIVLPGTDVAERSDIAMAETSRSGAGERRVELTAGEFFGEGGLISGRRRPATVVANEGCVLIEVQRLVMNRLIHSVDSVRQMIDRFFIERALSNLLLNLPRTEIQQLAAESEICSFPPDQFLFHEGDEPDGLHFIRRGSVAITKRRDGRDTIIQYVQAGNYVGEMAILVPGLKRSAGVRATVLTESMRIPTESVERFLGSNPEVRAEFEERASKLSQSDSARSADLDLGMAAFLISKTGAHEATDLLLIDESLCVRCDNCERACAESHEGISRLRREAGPTYHAPDGSQLHVPTACQHCENPKCMDDCPPDALRRRTTGEVYIRDNCIGCGNCAANCPYDVIQMASAEAVRQPSLLMRLLFGAKPRPIVGGEGGHAGEHAVKCDLCFELPEPRGSRAKAACVASCPTGAIVRVNPRQLVSEILEQA